MADSTTTDPTGTPTSSPTTSVAAASAGAAPGGVPAPTGTGTSVSAPTTSVAAASRGATPGTVPAPMGTEPTISISTTLPSTGAGGISIQFDYLPENVSFGVTSVFDPITSVPFTSARWMAYANTDLDEVNLQVKVVAGCNNCLTFLTGNTNKSSYSSQGPKAAAKFIRTSLIDLAQALYAVALPGNNGGVNGGGRPPPTCRLIVGRMFSAVGAFTRCSIAYNGPFDYDGSPTDMDVTLGFLPSEFYDGSNLATSLANISLTPRYTATGEMELAGNIPYALFINDTQQVAGQIPGAEGQDQGGDQSNPQTPTTTYPTITNESTIPQDQVQGPHAPTPTNAEAAAAEGYAPNEVYYVQSTDTYLFGPQDPVTHVPLEGAKPLSGNVVRADVESQRAGVRPPIGP